MRVILAEDEMLLREGLARLLREADVEVVATAVDAAEALRAVNAHHPDVLITDIRMPPGHGDEGLRLAEEMSVLHPAVGVLVLSQHLDSAYALRLLAARSSAVGYLLKNRVGDLEMLTGAIRRVAAGESVVDPRVVAALLDRQRRADPLAELTTRERGILELMAEGLSNPGICKTLFLSPKTIESHVRSIFLKLGLPPAPDDSRRVLAVLTYLRAVPDRSSPAG